MCIKKQDEQPYYVGNVYLVCVVFLFSLFSLLKYLKNRLSIYCNEKNNSTNLSKSFILSVVFSAI